MFHPQLTLGTGHPTWPAAGINGLWQAASSDNGFSRPADAFACLGACASLTRSDARSCSRGVGAAQRRWPKRVQRLVRPRDQLRFVVSSSSRRLVEQHKTCWDGGRVFIHFVKDIYVFNSFCAGVTLGTSCHSLHNSLTCAGCRRQCCMVTTFPTLAVGSAVQQCCMVTSFPTLVVALVQLCCMVTTFPTQAVGSNVAW